MKWKKLMVMVAAWLLILALTFFAFYEGYKFGKLGCNLVAEKENP